MWASWKLWGALALVGGLIGLFAFGFTTDPKKVPSPLVGKPAPEFEVKLLTPASGTLQLAELRGKPVVLNFWASWCAECRTEAAVLEAFHRRHGLSGQAVVLGVAIQDTPQQATAFAQRFGKSYLLGLDDAKGSIAMEYGIYGVPETFLIDTSGVIRKKHIGGVTTELLESFFVEYEKL